LNAIFFKQQSSLSVAQKEIFGGDSSGNRRQNRMKVSESGKTPKMAPTMWRNNRIAQFYQAIDAILFA